MLIPGETYRNGRGFIVRIFAIEACTVRGCDIAIGATYFPDGRWLSAETWRAHDGRAFEIGACALDIVS